MTFRSEPESITLAAVQMRALLIPLWLTPTGYSNAAGEGLKCHSVGFQLLPGKKKMAYKILASDTWQISPVFTGHRQEI